MDQNTAQVKPLNQQQASIPPVPKAYADKTVVFLRGKVIQVNESKNSVGAQVHIILPAKDEYAHPQRFVFWQKGKAPHLDTKLEQWCEVVTFGRKVQDKRGDSTTYYDTKLFALHDSTDVPF